MEEFWDEPATNAAVLHSAHDQLQGAWFASGGRRDAELLVSGRRFTVRFADGDIYMGVFDLNPGAQPMTLDMHIEEGPSRHKGKTALCICDHDGHTLRWCAAMPGRAVRPADFADDVKASVLLLVFRRDPTM
jgi:uncharacterized protein (TIGR03067 family)